MHCRAGAEGGDSGGALDWRWMRGMAFQNDTMAKVKLYLQANDHNQLKMFATAHKAAMNLNVNFWFSTEFHGLTSRIVVGV